MLIVFLFLMPKKVVLFPEIGQAKFVLLLTRPYSQMFIRIYTFCFKTHTQKQKAKESTEEKRKRKETKE